MMKETKRKNRFFPAFIALWVLLLNVGLSFHSHKIEAKSAADHCSVCQTGQQVRSGGVASPVSFRLPPQVSGIFVSYFISTPVVEVPLVKHSQAPPKA